MSGEWGWSQWPWMSEYHPARLEYQVPLKIAWNDPQATSNQQNYLCWQPVQLSYNKNNNINNNNNNGLLEVQPQVALCLLIYKKCCQFKVFTKCSIYIYIIIIYTAVCKKSGPPLYKYRDRIKYQKYRRNYGIAWLIFFSWSPDTRQLEKNISEATT